MLGVDPGIRSGCKLALVDGSGKFIGSGLMHLESASGRAGASRVLAELVAKADVRAIAVGNGTAGRETETFVRSAFDEAGINVPVVMVSEAGASVYSASDEAREEFPDLDLTIRAEAGIRPAIRLARDPDASLDSSPSVLLDLVGGRVTLEGLEFLVEGLDAPATIRAEDSELVVRRCLFRRPGVSASRPIFSRATPASAQSTFASSSRPNLISIFFRRANAASSTSTCATAPIVLTLTLDYRKASSKPRLTRSDASIGCGRSLFRKSKPGSPRSARCGRPMSTRSNAISTSSIPRKINANNPPPWRAKRSGNLRQTR